MILIIHYTRLSKNLRFLFVCAQNEVRASTKLLPSFRGKASKVALPSQSVYC